MVSQYPKMRLQCLKTDTSRKKDTRIRSFYPYVTQHRFFIPQTGLFDFEAEFESYPVGRTCDLLDALAYAPEIWFAPEAVTEFGEKARFVLPIGQDPRQWLEEQLREQEAEMSRSEITGY